MTPRYFGALLETSVAIIGLIGDRQVNTEQE
jgi:hypothetical protein